MGLRDPVSPALSAISGEKGIKVGLWRNKNYVTFNIVRGAFNIWSPRAGRERSCALNRARRALLQTPRCQVKLSRSRETKQIVAKLS